MNAVDCPDGLARCETGVVSASRVATVPQPCGGPPSRCNCPWEIVVANCEYGCAVEGVELEVDRSKAGSQLCAPAPDASVFARLTLAAPATAPCEEGQRYACSAGLTVECAAASPRAPPSTTTGSAAKAPSRSCVRGDAPAISLTPASGRTRPARNFRAFCDRCPATNVTTYIDALYPFVSVLSLCERAFLPLGRRKGRASSTTDRCLLASS
jgi:hypothetical protein